MESWPLNTKIGILGGGQLARMLIQAAQQIGLKTYVYCQSAKEPAAQVTSQFTLGTNSDPGALKKFLEEIEILIFESEFVDIQILRSALRQCQNPPKVVPNLELMERLQDRRTQKQLFVDANLPTANFVKIENKGDLQTTLKTFPKGLVLKTARGGYDGYGTAFVRSPKDLRKISLTGPCIAEEMIDFQRELAVIAVASQKDIFFLPLVESKQIQGKCDWVLGPTQHRAWPRLRIQLKKALRRWQYQGVMGIELFDTGTGLLINEIAPRVHNSGHYSMTALSESQFHLHLKCALGLIPREPTCLSKSFVMTNLIGESRQPFALPKILLGELHWYEKESNRPGRKMGHLNYLGPDSKSLLQLALRERKKIQK